MRNDLHYTVCYKSALLMWCFIWFVVDRTAFTLGVTKRKSNLELLIKTKPLHSESNINLNVLHVGILRIIMYINPWLSSLIGLPVIKSRKRQPKYYNENEIFLKTGQEVTLLLPRWLRGRLSSPSCACPNDLLLLLAQGGFCSHWNPLIFIQIWQHRRG